MGIRIEASSPARLSAVRGFNARLAERGVPYRLPEPPGGGADAGDPVCCRSFLAVDGAGAVHGGYTLKSQAFRVGTCERTVAFYQLPLSEGLIDRTYGLLGLQLLRDALLRQPLLFVLGVGSLREPLAQMLLTLKWPLTRVPFYFRLIRPVRVLDALADRRARGWQRLACLALARSGAAAVAGFGSRLASALGSRRDVAAAEFDGADERIDRVWEAARQRYRFIAARSAATVERLYSDVAPRSGPATMPFHPDRRRLFRLMVTRRGRLAGWAIALDTAMRDHRHFGDLRVGTIVDALAVPGEEPAVVQAAAGALADRGVDLVITNQMAGCWRAAAARAGFHRGPSGFLFGASQQLRGHLGDLTDAHLTRGDGDGPIHL